MEDTFPRSGSRPRRAVALAPPMPQNRLVREHLLGFLVFVAIGLWRLTIRIKLLGDEHRKAIEAEGRPVLHAIWHQRMVLGILRHPFTGTVTMASRSSDGDVIAGFLRYWGFRAVRGSSSRGGAEAFLEMAEALEGTTRWAALTPDGPRGPARRCKLGIARLAERLDAPVLPVGTSCSRPRFLRSWDRYLFPLPFSRGVVLYGPPVRRQAGESDEAFLARVDAAIDAQTEEADRLCGVVGAPRERGPRPPRPS